MGYFDFYSAAGLNSAEAALWIGIGLFLLLRSGKMSVRYPRKDLVVFGALFVAFGVSDVFEVNSGAWWEPWWLLLWKTTNAFGLLYFAGKLYLAGKARRRSK